MRREHRAEDICMTVVGWAGTEGMKDKRNRQHGTTLVELTVAVAVVAIVFAALMPLFVGIRNSSESRWAGLEMVQNARVLNEQLSRHLAQARRVMSVSGASTANGYIEFEAADGAVLRCEVASNGYVRFGPADDLAELAGPVKSLQFVCYDANDLESPTEVPACVRLVTWEAVFKSSARLTQGRSIMGASFLRTDARAIPDTTATTGKGANGSVVCSPTGGTGRHDEGETRCPDAAKGYCL
jgi:type II secretory pathway pseudopilin PulG